MRRRLDGGRPARRAVGRQRLRAGRRRRAQPDGASCAALDLCAPDWTICGGRGAVATALGVAACAPGAGFFATREKGSAAFECLGSGAMVMGCGSVGVPVTMGCAPLTAAAAAGCAALVG